MESFFHSMKAEELYGKSFASAEELRQALLRYIAFCNSSACIRRCGTSLLRTSSCSRAGKHVSTKPVHDPTRV
jgi:hypothetical protein